MRRGLREERSLCRIFFFSRRRRHTRSKRDWSSDVCSSDLFYPRILGITAHNVCGRILRGAIHHNDFGVPSLLSNKVQNLIQGSTETPFLVIGRNDNADVARSIQNRFPPCLQLCHPHAPSLVPSRIRTILGLPIALP